MEEIQSWLNEELLSLVLEASVKNLMENDENNSQKNELSTENQTNSIKDITLVDYKIERANTDSKNFCSAIYKVRVLYRHNKRDVRKNNYIIKKPKSAAINWFGEKEIQVYRVLPRIEEFIKCKIAPTLYLYRNKAMVMENLNKLEFQRANVKLLDFSHCKVSLIALAKYHAGTVLLHQYDSKLVEDTIGYESIVDTKSDLIGLIETSISTLGNEIATSPDTKQYSRYIQLIAKKSKSYFENKSKRDTFKVLNHGEFWLNNLLFKYDCNDVCEVRFVDFQICRYSPLTSDLQYFFGSSVDLDVRLNRIDELIAVYLETFNITMAELGISRTMTSLEFEKSFDEDYIMYFVGMISPLGNLLSDPDHQYNGPDITEEADHIEVKNQTDDNRASSTLCKFMKSKQYRDFVSVVLHDFEKKGVFKNYITLQAS